MTTAVSTNQPSTLKGMLGNEAIKKRFEEVLGAKAPGFISSIISATSLNKMLAECDPSSIVGAAAIAATLDLPINSSLGFAHIVPYNTQDGKKAQFQMGWKGYIQLAIRTGQYRTIDVKEIYSSQIISTNKKTGLPDFDFSKEGGEVVGYMAYYELMTGFEKVVYWNIAKIQSHGKKYSKSYENKFGQWQTNFDGMAKKTIVKHLLSTWGILSIDMQRAITTDQAVAKDATGDHITYEDSTATEVEDTKEIETSEATTSIPSADL